MDENSERLQLGALQIGKVYTHPGNGAVLHVVAIRAQMWNGSPRIGARVRLDADPGDAYPGLSPVRPYALLSGPPEARVWSLLGFQSLLADLDDIDD